MVGTIAIDKAIAMLCPTILNPNHPFTERQNVRFSNVVQIEVFGFRAPTVIVQLMFSVFHETMGVERVAETSNQVQ